MSCKRESRDGRTRTDAAMERVRKGIQPSSGQHVVQQRSLSSEPRSWYMGPEVFNRNGTHNQLREEDEMASIEAVLRMRAHIQSMFATNTSKAMLGRNVSM